MRRSGGVEPIWLMWGGIFVVVIGFTGLWAPFPLDVVKPDLVETVGRWLMRAGLAVATLGATAHIVIG